MLGSDTFEDEEPEPIEYKNSTCIYHRYVRPMRLVLDADGTVAIELGKR